MATYNFSSYSGTSNSVTFNPETDVFTFDSTSISPNAINFSFTLSTATFTFGGTSVTLNTSPLSLTPTNFTFANGGQFLIGDQLTATTGDFSTGKQSSGGSGNDTIMGFDGQDTMAGNDGNDSFFLLSSNTLSADVVDGGAGLDRVTFFSFNPANAAFLAQIGSVSVNLASGTATQGANTVQLSSIEAVRIAGSNGNTYTMTGSGADESFIVGGGTGTTTAVYNIDGAGGKDYLAIFSTNTTPASISLQNSTATWGSATINYQNVENLSGSAGNDLLTGNAGNNEFNGRNGNDQIDGDSGVDTAIYNNAYANYTITQLTGDHRFTVASTAEGTDTLNRIERLQFSDKKIAYDVGATENAGEALLFIGTLAFPLLSSPSIVGTILSLFDQDKTMLEMSQLAIDVGLITSLAGSNSNVDLVRLAFRNVVGVEASTEVANSLATLIQGSGGSLSQAAFLAAVAQLDLNQQHVNLVGLQTTGVEFI